MWIEILQFDTESKMDYVTPYAGVWIEIADEHTPVLPKTCHSLRGSVDWNDDRGIEKGHDNGHSLRGSVDWNPEKTDADGDTY